MLVLAYENETIFAAGFECLPDMEGTHNIIRYKNISLDLVNKLIRLFGERWRCPMCGHKEAYRAQTYRGGKACPVCKRDPDDMTTMVHERQAFMEFKLRRPGLIKIRRDGIKFIPKKALNSNFVEREMRKWTLWEEACQNGDVAEVMDVGPAGFEFRDGSKRAWNAEVIPSPFRGFDCFAKAWGVACEANRMPCGTWLEKNMPQGLKKRIAWLERGKLGRGEFVKLFFHLPSPVIQKVVDGLFITRLEEPVGEGK